MRCRFCGSKDVEVYLRMYNLRLCRADFLSFVKKRVSYAIEKFRLFREGEEGIVAVSGGKDSLALLHILHDLGWNVSGYFLDLGIEGASDVARKRIEAFSDKFGIPVHIERLEEVFGWPIPEVARRLKRPACSLCGTLKRYYMNRFALGKVLATGHTMFDEAGTLLSNVLQWKVSYLARQAPKLSAEEGFARKVKPLVFVTERETAMYCFFQGIDYVEAPCPLSKGATSRVFKRHLLALEEDMPGTVIRFLKGFYSAKKQITFPDEERQDLSPCQSCGYPTSAGELCAVCRMKAKLESSPA